MKHERGSYQPSVIDPSDSVWILRDTHLLHSLETWVDYNQTLVKNIIFRVELWNPVCFTTILTIREVEISDRYMEGGNTYLAFLTSKFGLSQSGVRTVLAGIYSVHAS